MRAELWTFGSWALIELNIERNTKDLYHSPSDLRRSDIETRECLSPFCQFNQKRMLKIWKDPLPVMLGDSVPEMLLKYTHALHSRYSSSGVR